MKRLIAFTLIEILVVTSIIGLLAAAGAVSYNAFTKSARDARRKADVEQIRGAIELYRSNVGVYPTPGAIGGINCSTSVSITEGSNTYMSKVPLDPKCPTYNYFYTSSSPYTNYTLGAYLENGGSSSCGSCFGSTACNYCAGPYGQQ